MVLRYSLLLLCFTVCWVYGVVDPAYAAHPIKIAMITAKTGEAGKSNSISFDGARYAVDAINEAGGVLGRPIELLEYDNLSTPEGSAEAARHAIRDGAVAVVGCNWSSHSLAMAKVLQAAEIPMISHMSTNIGVTRVGDYIFRICFIDSFQGVGLARFAYDRLKTRRAIMLVDESRTYSTGLAQVFRESFEKLGGEIAWVGTYGESDIPYDALLEEGVTHDPDVVFIPGGYEDVSGFYGRIRDRALRWEVLSADGIGINMYEYIGNKADDIYFSGHWVRAVDTAESRAFVKGYESKVGPINEDTLALVNDCFNLLADAIRRAGTTHGPTLRTAIAETRNFPGVTGEISFDEHGDPIKPMTINKLKFGGLLYVEQVYP